MSICNNEVLCFIKFIPLWSFILVVFLFRLLYDLSRRAAMASAVSASLNTNFRLYLSAGVVALGYGLYQSRNAIIGIFMGPGKYSRIALLLVILANYKSIPFMWHVRLARIPRL